MIVPKKIINEILLIFGVIGSERKKEGAAAAAAAAATSSSSTNASSNKNNDTELVPVEDCINWLQDLQRVLKRDHEIYRPISLLIGKWKIIAQKLIPLVMSTRYDRALVLTVCKILVLLTKPMSEAAKKAGRMVVDAKSGKVDDNVLWEQIQLRDNAIEQSEMLMEYKRMFVRHPSHHHAFQNPLGSAQETDGETKKAKTTGLLSIFTSLLAEPLSKTGSARTSADHLTIELVLHLIRNLLCIAPLNTFGSTEKSQHAMQLHRDLLIVLQEEDVLDVLTIVGQEMERRENSGYNLLVMEILSCLLRGQDPSEIALATTNMAPTPTLSAPITLANAKKKSKTPAKTRIIRTTTTSRAINSGPNSLKAHLQTERQKTHMLKSSRHSHFGGTLMISKHGKQSYVSASDYLAKSSKDGIGKGQAASALGQPTRRKNKKAEVFVGSGKSSALNSRPGASSTLSRDVAGPNSKRAKLALHKFCTKFIEDCYGPVMKSLKNEFRRDSSRLEDGDKTMFFRIVWFFHQWWRVGREQKNAEAAKENSKAKGAEIITKEKGKLVFDESSSAAQNLIFTMDVFMFNLVLSSTDEFIEHKKPAALAHTVSLYTEMLQVLHTMYDSKDSTENMMALGLMDRLFYGNEPLDRVPKLLSRWSPGMFSREYLCDLVECTHLTWKLLDTNAVRCLQSVPSEESERKRPKDAVERMNLTASEFVTDHWFMRKFVSNQIVFMYTQLLSQYAVNAAHVNRHIVAFFIRLCKFSIKSDDDVGDDLELHDACGKNDLATKPSTLEPMLYNIGLLNVLDKVLNDHTIRDKEDFSALLMFASSFMKRFARAAEANPILYVEALFKHPNPQKFCELTTNMYVNEELRMIAVRDLLLEDQKRYEQAEAADNEKESIEEEGDVENNAQGYDDDGEEELEFNGDDDEMATDGIGKKKRRRKSRKSRKSKSNGVMTEESQPENDESNEEEAEFIENDGSDGNGVKEDNEESEQKYEASEASVSPTANREDIDISHPPEEGTTDANAAESPTMSGKKRIRKSQEADDDDDSDEEDFLGSSAAVRPAKAIKRVIFEDDDDD